MNAQPSAVLFDLDGTLLDTGELIIQSFQHLARRYLGRSLDVAAEILPNFGEPLATTLARWGVAPVEELIGAYRAFNLAHHDELVRAFPGAAEALSRLRADGRRVGVVTAKLGATARRGLELTGLAPLVETVVGADGPLPPKPAPDTVWLALRRLDSPAGSAVMVGDSPHDLRAARAAGVRPVAVGWSVFPRERLLAEGPEAVVADFGELLDRLGL